MGAKTPTRRSGPFERHRRAACTVCTSEGSYAQQTIEGASRNPRLAASGIRSPLPVPEPLLRNDQTRAGICIADYMTERGARQ